VEPDITKLVKFAREIGVAEVKLIRAEDVVVSDWVRLKCQFGCPEYGQRLTCPPRSPSPEEFRKILKDYQWALLFKIVPGDPETASEEAHNVAAKLEREAFLEGYYSAFALSSGTCPYCDECTLKVCAHYDVARPSMEGCGVDVFSTVRRAGFDLNVVTRRDAPFIYFGLLLLK